MWRIWRNDKSKYRSEPHNVGEYGKMIRANKLTQLEGPQNVGAFGENGEFGESGDFGKISPRLLTK